MEREVAPRLEAVARSDGFAELTGKVAHLQRSVQSETARATRRLLHLVNLPAATDVTRILHELGQLRLQVRELSARLDAAEARAVEARAADGPRAIAPARPAPRGRRTTSGGDRGRDAGPR